MTQDREGYALAAGLALGLITLGKGRAAAGLADLHLEEKLRWECVGLAWFLCVPAGDAGTPPKCANGGGLRCLPSHRAPATPSLLQQLQSTTMFCIQPPLPAPLPPGTSWWAAR